MRNLITSLAILAMSAMGANAQSLECSAKIDDRITTTDISELESALKLYAKKLDLKKDEFETTAAFKERLKRAEDSVGFKKHYVSIIPVDPEILNIIAPYDADQEIFNIFNSAWSGSVHSNTPLSKAVNSPSLGRRESSSIILFAFFTSVSCTAKEGCTGV